MLASARLRSTFGRRDLGDPFWSNVSLLLQPPNVAGGTNAQFVDVSGNNVAVTRVGTVANTSDSPYGLGYGAAFFNSNGNYLRLPAIAFGTNDFTIETWIKIDSLNNGALIVDARSANGSSATNGPYMFFGVDSGQGGKLVTYVNTAYRAVGATVVPLGVWNHVAICRSSGTTRLFLNGVLDASWADATNYAAGHPLISAAWFPSTTSVHQMADYRISNGTARYTTNFTPPTAPLEAVTGTSVLLPMQGKILDKSPQSNTVTVVGDAQTSTATPLDGMGSVTFDGVGDGLRADAGSEFAFGTGDFTIESWVRPTASTGYNCIFTTRATSNSGSAVFCGLDNNNLKPVFYNYFTSTGSLTLNQWSHVAWVRSGSTVTIYIDGVASGSGTVTTNFTDTAASIGFDYATSSANLFYGQLADLRITKGIARYTQAFTPPTKPLTAVGPANQTLAIGGDITDIDGWRYHTFTSSGTFTVLTLSDDNTVEYLIVGGGGGGGRGGAGVNSPRGGGGAGAVETGTFEVSLNSWTATVGLGGRSIATQTAGAENGGNSSVFGVTALGGGAGGGPRSDNVMVNNGSAGGSGGGAAGGWGAGSGGTASGSRTYAGGSCANTNAGSTTCGGGGGGATQAGRSVFNTTTAGNGGQGISPETLGFVIDGHPIIASGGGGSTTDGSVSGVGGTGASNGSKGFTAPTAATTYGSGGGGGGFYMDGSAGYQGVVIIRYPI